MRWILGWRIASAAIALALIAGSASAQTTDDPIGAAVAAAAVNAHASDPPATLTFANRKILELRATIAGRPPAVRASQAADTVGRIVEQKPDAQVTMRRYDQGIVLNVGDQPVGVGCAVGADPLAGETMQAKADAGYFVDHTRGFTNGGPARIEAAFLAAYRWQYIVSGVQDPRFAEILGGMITPAQGNRIGAALQPILEG